MRRSPVSAKQLWEGPQVFGCAASGGPPDATKLGALTMAVVGLPPPRIQTLPKCAASASSAAVHKSDLLLAAAQTPT